MAIPDKTNYPHLTFTNGRRSVFGYLGADLPEIVVHNETGDIHTYVGSCYGLTADELRAYAKLVEEAADYADELNR